MNIPLFSTHCDIRVMKQIGNVNLLCVLFLTRTDPRGRRSWRLSLPRKRGAFSPKSASRWGKWDEAYELCR
jgi:hypothetical protein